MVAEFNNTVDENNAYREPLARIFGRKVKRAKQAGGQGGEGGDDGVASSDDGSSADDESDDDASAQDDACPAGCDPRLYDKVLPQTQLSFIRQQQIMQRLQPVSPPAMPMSLKGPIPYRVLGKVFCVLLLLFGSLDSMNAVQ